MSKKILVVDDEKEIVELVELYFRNKEYILLKAYNGIDALEIFKNNNIGLAIVDIMMPGLDGYTLIREIRKISNIPIIVISAKSEGYDKVLGLDIGADDYVTKPFDPLELIARVNAQFRRCYSLKNIEPHENIIKIGDLAIDKGRASVTKDGQDVILTYKEFKLLELFMENKNRVLTKKNLFEQVWNEEYLHDDNAIMVHISNLRDKIEDDSRSPKYIKTIRGIGYRFEDKKI
ncbi:response regulator transcription factor [Clostridium carnis]